MLWPRPNSGSRVRLFARRGAVPEEPQTSGKPRVYALPAGQPFLTALAEALLRGNLPVPGGRAPDPLQLADITLYLPSRRLVRPLQEAFLQATKAPALLLPRIKALSEGSEDLDLIDGVDQFTSGGPDDMPKVISDLERRMVLTTLALRWGALEEREGRSGGRVEPYAATGARTPAQAARLAGELARLMDELETESVDFSRLQGLVPEEHAGHWSRTLAFLRIVTDNWPKILAAGNQISPVTRRQRLMHAEIERLRTSPPAAPVIVAGVTDADPFARALIEAVAALPNGALVLPALDQALDEESWTSIAEHPEHPQFGLRKLLDALKLSRSDIAPLGGVRQLPAHRARWSLVCEAMRPAATTDRWHAFTAAATKKEMAEALTDVSLVEAASADEEAEVVALMLREAAEQKDRTAMLVTADRTLARRVSARLAVWDLRVDDMGGMPFPRTRVGAFLDLVALAAEKDFQPVALMALLKHPFCRLGLSAGEMRRGAQALELAAFRSPYFGNGLDGIATAIDQAHARSWQHSAVRRMREDDWQAARDLVGRLQGAFAPMAALLAAPEPVSMQALAGAHYAAAENLARSAEATESGVLRQGEAGEWASQFFASLIDPNLSAPQMPPAEYPDFYRTLVAEKTIRPRAAPHPRLSICDPFEARLQQADLVILGALNESTWPRAADPGPWLNRPMRQTLGLPAPEERIGQSAHDFTSLLAAPHVALTRAAKVDGAPTVPSRWLLRLQALVAGMKLELKSEKPWLAWAQARSAIGSVRPVSAPEPRPALAARPRKLSVTSIETWIANPYGIFARHILGLDVLPALGAPPSASLRGQIVHEVLGRFAQKYPQALPGDVAGALTAVAQQVFADYTGNPRVAAFWSQRFSRFAQWFAETEGARRAGMTATLAEVSGKLVLAGPGGPFTLTARADRIDVGPRGLIITDYKTAQGVKELAAKALDGRSPQLPLEAAIAMDNGFAGVPPAPIAQLRYISTSGGEPPGQDIPVGANDVAGLAAEVRDGLARLIAAFDRETTPYKATRRARFQYKYDDYAHLARVAEWAADTGEEE